MGSEGRLETVVVWFRRDLRVFDNPALIAALNSARNVVPLFIWAPEEEGQFQPGRQTRWWSKHSVLCLGRRLDELGSRLVIRRAQESAEALKAVVAETGAQAVFFNHLYDSISMVRDQQVKDELRGAGLLVSSFNADLLYEPWEVLDEQKQPFTTFKSYWDRCLSMPYAPPLPLPEPTGPLPHVPAALSSLTVEQVDWFMSAEQEASTQMLAHRWDPAPSAAVERLEAFLDAALPCFEHDRAKTDRESTTMLSPWIHFGSLSVRHVYYRVAQKHAAWAAAGQERGQSCLDFLTQMGYREYSRYLAFHFPFITERSMLSHLAAVPWRLDQDAFKAWRQGRTGYPLVDAAMRQLWSMGWCHNRARVVASHFLVKHLLLPWQWGLKHLWDCQIDADLECDALGWQYVSGCLADSHPFSYLVDLEAEWRRFDPDGHYVRRWLPVLAPLPSEHIHQPWKAPPEVLAAAGVELGVNYPWPIITPEAAKEGVAMAATVVARCAASGSGGGSSGGSTNTGFGSSLVPRKEPYRPPTDPCLMSSFLAASRGGASWQDALPPLYIHSASGHPLSLVHSAQQRPLWGPASLRRLGGSGGSQRDHLGRYCGLHTGRMGQQQLLVGPAAEAAGVRGARLLLDRRGSGSCSGSEDGASDGDGSSGGGGVGFFSQSTSSQSGSMSVGAGRGYGQSLLVSESGDNSVADMEEEGDSGGGGGACSSGTGTASQHAAESEQVVPSASGGGDGGDEGEALRRGGGRPRGGGRGGADLAMDDDMDVAMGGGGGSLPAASATTACSHCTVKPAPGGGGGAGWPQGGRAAGTAEALAAQAAQLRQLRINPGAM